MSSIVRQKVGNKLYLYESTSFRNAEGKPRNNRVLIGKVDPVTGNPVYKPEYLQRMAANGSPVVWLSRFIFCWTLCYVHFTTSIGIYSAEPIDSELKSFDEIYQQSDLALYAAKNTGRNRVVQRTNLDAIVSE